MAKTKKKQNQIQTFDGVFILKLVMYVILGSLWLKVHKNGSSVQYPMPLGLILGIIFTSHEHFRIDRKIEYAVLVVAALFGYMAPYGLFVSF